MANKQFDARIQWKRDTSANWTSNNPVLLNGEIIIVDTDGGETRFKIGDGIKTYTQLPFEDEVVRNLINSKASQDDVNKAQAAANEANVAIEATAGEIAKKANSEDVYLKIETYNKDEIDEKLAWGSF